MNCNIREQSSFYFRFETLKGGRKESISYGMCIPAVICAKIMYYAEYNRVLCSDVAEYMIRDVDQHRIEPNIIQAKEDEEFVYFNFTPELGSILKVKSILNCVSECDLIRSYLIYWADKLNSEYDKL